MVVTVEYMGNSGWREHALCRGKTALFFPVGDDELPPAAVALCSACPSRAPCLDFALENPRIATHGIWGGLTLKQRRTVIRNARRRLQRSA